MKTSFSALSKSQIREPHSPATHMLIQKLRKRQLMEAPAYLRWLHWLHLPAGILSSLRCLARGAVPGRSAAAASASCGLHCISTNSSSRRWMFHYWGWLDTQHHCWGTQDTQNDGLHHISADADSADNKQAEAHMAC